MIPVVAGAISHLIRSLVVGTLLVFFALIAGVWLYFLYRLIVDDLREYCRRCRSRMHGRWVAYCRRVVSLDDLMIQVRNAEMEGRWMLEADGRDHRLPKERKENP